MDLDLGAFDAAATEAERAPVQYARFSAWQESYLSDASRFRVIRAANQLGKTHVCCWEVVADVLGTNPFRARRWSGPINVTIVGRSIEQMSMEGAIMERLWSMLPKGDIDPRVSFVRGRGIVGTKYPAIRFTSGPGVGSVIRFRTYEQDPQTHAGSVAHKYILDEPAPEQIYDEILPRIMRNQGDLTIAFTPTPDMPPQTWLRTLVDQGQFSEHWVPMRPEHTQVRGFSRPFLTQEQIDEQRHRCPEVTRPLRFEAAWETVSTERWLSSYEEQRHLLPIEIGDRRLAGAWLGVGIDHGLVPGKQRAMLLAIVRRHDPQRAVAYYLDEVALPDITSPLADAKNILAMLKRNGLEYVHVDEWVGDRSTGEGLQLKSKSNGTLRIQLLAQAQISSNDPEAKLIITPRKGDGSVIAGLHLMNAMFAEDRMFVHPRCTEFRQFLLRFKGDSRDVLKDVGDAGRYILERGLSQIAANMINVRARTGHAPRGHEHTRSRA